MMKKLVLLIAILAISVPASANLHTNGDFEMGDLTGWLEWGAPWGGPYVREVVTDPVKEGTFALHLGASNGSFGVAQQIPTVPGVEYTISGWWMVPVGSAHWAEVLFLNDDGRSPLEQMDGPLNSSIILKVDGWGMNGQTFSAWEPYDAGTRWYPSGPFSTTLTATGDSIWVGLKSGASGGNVQSYFDDVSVTAVPEPCTMLALAAGLSALAIRRRK